MVVYMADSSFYGNPSGGRKYHIENENGMSLCGKLILNNYPGEKESDLPKYLLCKKCMKLADRQ